MQGMDPKGGLEIGIVHSPSPRIHGIDLKRLKSGPVLDIVAVAGQVTNPVEAFPIRYSGNDLREPAGRGHLQDSGIEVR